MIHKCYFLGLVVLSLGIQRLKYSTKNKWIDYTRESSMLSPSFILVSFVAYWQRIALRKIYDYYIKPCTFYRPDKVFSRMHSLIQNLFIGDQHAKLNFLKGNLIQDSVCA